MKAGGDSAAIMGMCKALLAADAEAHAAGLERLIDVNFIAEHTSGFTATDVDDGIVRWRVCAPRATTFLPAAAAATTLNAIR